MCRLGTAVMTGRVPAGSLLARRLRGTSMLCRLPHRGCKASWCRRNLSDAGQNGASTQSPVPAEPLSETVRNWLCPPLKRHSMEGTRYYSVPGCDDLFPSVTSVLNVLDKPGLKQLTLNFF